ncbi:MAG: cell division FtsA domain-containing protein, partial [Pseudomonadota bacterium]
VSAAYGAAVSCVTKDEAERGVLLVDCGARTTSLAVFHAGRLQFVSAINGGADHLTQELATKLGVAHAAAERIKTLRVSVGWPSYDALDFVEVSPLGAVSATDTVELPRGQLSEILRPLAEAMLARVADELDRAPVAARDAARRGIVLTGGGAQQDGLVELATDVLGVGTRLGRPDVFAGWADPQHAAASGGLALVAGDDGGVGYVARRAARIGVEKPIERLGQWLRESLGVA